MLAPVGLSHARQQVVAMLFGILWFKKSKHSIAFIDGTGRFLQ